MILEDISDQVTAEVRPEGICLEMTQVKGIPGRENHQDKEVKGFCVQKNRRKSGAVCNVLREEVEEMRLGKYVGSRHWESIDQKPDTNGIFILKMQKKISTAYTVCRRGQSESPELRTII